ncbi:hypothetical protein RND81_12G092200 [Saponaria officinalis]|uniref:Uncharacterized protein n=1 Tax=Saponaria officinalis TaxID=3572 RepID=A0AAW1H8E4_SAPOF
MNEPTEAPPKKTVPNNDIGKAVVEEGATPVAPPQTGATSSSITTSTPSTHGKEDVLQKQLLKKKAYVSALKKTATLPNTSPDQIVNHIARDWLPNAIAFSDEDLPPLCPTHNLALYINVESKRKSLPVTLIDNGSAMNVLPLDMAYQLGLEDKDLIPCNEGVRSFDGTRQNIKGTITLYIKTGPIERHADFQVIDIAPSYNMLLGRPWIYSVQAITYTLHQKVKLPLDGKIFTSEASNFREILEQQRQTEKKAT